MKRLVAKVAPCLVCVAVASGQTSMTSLAKGDMSGQQLAKQVIVRTAGGMESLVEGSLSNRKDARR